MTLNFRKVSFLASAGTMAEMPAGDVPEIALLGRSNVGKSSLINALTQSRMARSSSTPGKTRRLNFYEVDGSLRLVDLPGYGYAKVSKAERNQWGALIESYLAERDVLAGCLLIVDARHEPQESDLQMAGWIHHAEAPALVVATKADKLKGGAANRQVGLFAQAFRLPVIPFSATHGQGVREVAVGIIDLLDPDRAG